MINAVLIWFPTLVIYIFWLLFGIGFWSSIGAVLVIATFLVYFFSKHRIRITLTPYNLVIGFIILAFLISDLWVLSPLVVSQQVNGQTFLGFSGMGDYFKHSYVVTALTERGLNLRHPFYPISDFRYYYGYYLIPALITLFFGKAQLYILIAYVLFTNVIALSLVNKIIVYHIPKIWLRVLVFMLTLVGYSVHLIPFLWLKGSNSFFHLWQFDLQAGFRYLSLYQAFMWTPQHMLVAVMVLYLIHQFSVTKKINWYSVFGIIFYSLLSSAFVSIYLLLVLLLFFLFVPHLRKLIIGSGAAAVIVLIPYLLRTFSSGGGLFSITVLNPYQLVENHKILNIILAFVTEVGWLPFLGILLIPCSLKLFGIKKTLVSFLLVYGMFGATFLIRTSGWNDFSMRSVEVSQLLLPIVLGILVIKIKSRWWKSLVVAGMGLALLMAIPDVLAEPWVNWKKRGIMGYDESRMLLHIRNMPRSLRLAAVGREEWIYKIPGLGFKSILTNDLYDASVYLDPKLGVMHSYLENELRGLFMDPLNDVDKKSLEQLTKVTLPLNFDQIIIDENIYIKRGINPWTVILDDLKVPVQAQIGRFRFYDKSELLKSVSGHKIVLGMKEKIAIKERFLPLKKGLWFIQSCNMGTETVRMVVEPDDYYNLIEGSTVM